VPFPPKARKEARKKRPKKRPKKRAPGKDSR
jgi:hypothetical protein